MEQYRASLCTRASPMLTEYRYPRKPPRGGVILASAIAINSTGQSGQVRSVGMAMLSSPPQPPLRGGSRAQVRHLREAHIAAMACPSFLGSPSVRTSRRPAPGSGCAGPPTPRTPATIALSARRGRPRTLASSRPSARRTLGRAPLARRFAQSASRRRPLAGQLPRRAAARLPHRTAVRLCERGKPKHKPNRWVSVNRTRTLNHHKKKPNGNSPKICQKFLYRVLALCVLW